MVRRTLSSSCAVWECMVCCCVHITPYYVWLQVLMVQLVSVYGFPLFFMKAHVSSKVFCSLLTPVSPKTLFVLDSSTFQTYLRPYGILP